MFTSPEGTVVTVDSSSRRRVLLKGPDTWLAWSKDAINQCMVLCDNTLFLEFPRDDVRLIWSKSGLNPKNKKPARAHEVAIDITPKREAETFPSFSRRAESSISAQEEKLSQPEEAFTKRRLAFTPAPTARRREQPKIGDLEAYLNGKSYPLDPPQYNKLNKYLMDGIHDDAKIYADNATPGDCHSLFTTLQDRFQNSSASSVRALLASFFTMKTDNPAKLYELIAGIRQLADSLAAVGFDTPEFIMRAVFCNGLPSDYDPVITVLDVQLDTSGVGLFSQDVRGSGLTYAHCISTVVDFAVKKGYVKADANAESTSLLGSTTGGGQRPPRNPKGPLCSNCNKGRHPAKDCLQKFLTLPAEEKKRTPCPFKKTKRGCKRAPGKCEFDHGTTDDSAGSLTAAVQETGETSKETSDVFTFMAGNAAIDRDDVIMDSGTSETIFNSTRKCVPGSERPASVNILGANSSKTRASSRATRNFDTVNGGKLTQRGIVSSNSPATLLGTASLVEQGMSQVFQVDSNGVARGYITKQRFDLDAKQLVLTSTLHPMAKLFKVDKEQSRASAALEAFTIDLPPTSSLLARTFTGNLSKLEVLHQRTHIGERALKGLTGWRSSLPRPCDGCYSAKMSKQHISTLPKKRASRPLQQVLTDQIVDMPRTPEGYTGASVFLDSNTRLLFVQIQKQKAQHLESLKRFKSKAELLVRDGLKVENLHSDSEAIYKSKETKAFCDANGIAQTHSPPYRHELNGVERHIRTLKEMTFAFLFAAGLPLKFWPFGMVCASVVMGLVPQTIDGKLQAPLGAFSGKDSSKTLKCIPPTFGCEVKVLVNERKTGEEHAYTGVNMGPSWDTPGAFNVLNLSNGQIGTLLSRNAKMSTAYDLMFNETSFPFLKT